MINKTQLMFATSLCVAAALLLNACQNGKADKADPRGQTGTITLSAEQQQKIRVESLASVPFHRILKPQVR